MPDYYTDSAAKSLWVLTQEEEKLDGHNKTLRSAKEILTCFAAKNNSGFHIGQQIHNPKLQNSNWKPLEGEILVDSVLTNV